MVSDQFSPRLFQGMDETKIGTSRPPLRPKGNAVAVAHLVSVVSLTGDRETLWGGRRGNGNFVAGCNRWSAAMPQPNDLSRSLVALDQNSTIIAVIEMSQSSWLV